MNIVFLETASLGDDISFEKFQRLGNITLYDTTSVEHIKSRAQGADILVLNKLPVCMNSLGENPSVRLICVTATGMNNIDFDYTNAKHISVANVKGYSTDSVVQHTFALTFYLLEKLAYYDDYVKSGRYTNDTQFTHFANKFHELYGKTWGIVGLGTIGKKVAATAKAFGCRVIYYSTSGKNKNADFLQVSFDTLLRESDIISIHAPLNSQTTSLFNREAFSKINPSSILINVGRGGIVEEQALRDALDKNLIAGAGLDVLSQEPLSKENPLFDFADSTRLIITPHLAWATVEARTRLIEETYQNMVNFLQKE